MRSITRFLAALAVVALPIFAGAQDAPSAAVEQPEKDATARIQALLDEKAKAGGGAVELPPGRVRLEGSLRVPAGVTLAGSWDGPHHANLKTGTVLLAVGGRGEENGAPLIALEPGAKVRGLTVWYPEQKIDELAPYPWTIRAKGMHCTVEDVTLVNPWQAIDFGTEWNELHVARNVFGCPLKTGVFIDGCTDIGRLENVHFSPHYWFRDEGDGEPRPDPEKLFNHLIANADGFVFGRTDWEYVLNTFCYGYRAGYRFVKTEKGVCNGNFLGIGADGCENAFLVEAAAPYGLLVTNGEFVGLRAPEPIQVVVRDTARDAVVQFSNCAFWGPVAQIARLEGGTTTFSQCNFHAWDADKGRPAIEATGGSVSIQNSVFHRNGTHAKIGEGVRSAIVSGNLMAGGPKIESAAKEGRLQAVGNAEWGR